MAENDTKTRADFATDSEWYTYMITNEEETVQDEDDIITLSDEDIKKKFEKLQKYQCVICKNEFYEVLSEHKNEDFSMMPFSKMAIFKHLERCPFCDARRKQFLTIKSKAQLKKEKEKKKEELKLEKNRKISLDKIKKELLRQKEKLDIMLERGEITADRYYYLFINLAFSVVKWNLNRDIIDRKEQLYKFARDYAVECSKLVLDKAKIEESYDRILERYSNEQDDIQLELEKQIIENSFETKLEFEKQEGLREIEKLEAKLEMLKSDKEFQEKKKEERMLREEKYRDKQDKKLEDRFEEELKQLVKKK